MMVGAPLESSRPEEPGRRRYVLAGWLAWAGAPIAVVVGLAVASPLIAVAGPIAIAGIVFEVRRRRRRQATLAEAEALTTAVDQMVQQLRSGASLYQACWVASRGRSRPAGFGPLSASLRAGSTLLEAIGALRNSPDPSVRLTALTLTVLATNGGPAIPALQRLRHTLMGRLHRQRRAEAQAASALSSAGVLVLAPSLFSVVAAGVEPALTEFYLRRPLGAACVVCSLMLSASGWWWMQRTVRRVWGSGP